MIYPEGWLKSGKYLVKTFPFEDFKSAVSFVKDIVPLADDLSHHPDIEIFSYKNVKIKLVTHEKGDKITEKDLHLALKINHLLH